MTSKSKTLIAASAIALAALGGCSAADVLASGEEITAVEVQTSSSAVIADATSDVSETVTTATQVNVEDHASADDSVWEASEVISVSLGGEITANGEGVLIEGSAVTITEAGTYHISGTLGEGQIVVEAGNEAVVRLILDNADITNSTGAAIAVMSAEKAVVMLADGTDNTLGTASADTFGPGGDGPGADPGAAGTETVGDYHIYINGGTIVVDAIGDGIDSNGAS